MNEQHQNDHRQQESVVPHIAQCDDHTKRTQPDAREQKPPQKLVSRRLASTPCVNHDIEADIRNIRMKQTAIPCYGIKHSHRQQKYTRCNREMNLLSRPQKEHTQKQQHERRVLQAHRRHQHRHECHHPDHPRPIDRRSHTQHEQRHQQRSSHKLGHRLVGKPDQLIPERTRQQRNPRRWLSKMPPRKKIHPHRNQQRNRTKHQLDTADIPERFTEADEVKHLQHTCNYAGHQPRTRPVKELPVSDTVAKNQTMRWLQILHNFVRMQNKIATQRNRRPHCKR